MQNTGDNFLVSEKEGRKVDMFVIVSTYRAKVGEEDAIIALHEDWERNQGPNAKDYFSWELLRKDEAPREFITIAHFKNKELAQVATSDLELDAWYGRLMSLIEEGPVRTDCMREWQLHQDVGCSVQAARK